MKVGREFYLLFLCIFVGQCQKQEDIRECISFDITEVQLQQEIDSLNDFGGPSSIYMKDDLYDMIISPNDAIEARQFLSEVFLRYGLQGKYFEIGKTSDVLTELLPSLEESSRKCGKCGKQFLTYSYVNYHLLRDHLSLSMRFNSKSEDSQEKQENQGFFFIDKICRFLDCTRDKLIADSQSPSIQIERIQDCLYFTKYNIIPENEIKDNNRERLNSELIQNNQKYVGNNDEFLRNMFSLCQDIVQKNSELVVGSKQSIFNYYLLKCAFWFGVMLSVSYYSLLLLTEEGRRAWLSTIEKNN